MKNHENFESTSPNWIKYKGEFIHVAYVKQDDGSIYVFVNGEFQSNVKNEWQKPSDYHKASNFQFGNALQFDGDNDFILFEEVDN